MATPPGFFLEDADSRLFGANRLYRAENGELHTNSFYVETIQGHHFWEGEDLELVDEDYAFAAAHPRVRRISTSTVSSQVYVPTPPVESAQSPEDPTTSSQSGHEDSAADQSFESAISEQPIETAVPPSPVLPPLPDSPPAMSQPNPLPFHGGNTPAPQPEPTDSQLLRQLIETQTIAMQQAAQQQQQAAQQMQQMMATMQQMMATMQTVMANLPANSGLASQASIVTHTVEKPQAFSGDDTKTRGADARRFLAAFTAYALSVPALSPSGQRNDTAWIRSFLGFMKGEAGIWATPHLENFGIGQVPFEADFEKLKEAFRSRFEVVTADIAAKRALRLLFQKGMDVPSYTARFNEHADRTGYGKQDLRDRYYENLSESIKDSLAVSERAQATLEELVAAATVIDRRLRERQEEKRGHRTETSSAPPPPKPADSDAMQIDAIRPGSKRSRWDFRTEMRGRCYGCGSKEHVKSDGHHERDLCQYCLRLGHQAQVCQDKYLGLEPKLGLKKGKAPAHQVRAGTIEEVAEESSGSPPSAAKTENNTSQEQMISMLERMQEEMAEYRATIAALKKSAF